MIKLRNITKVNTEDISALRSESFFQKIMANYTLMNADVSAKDLLHVVSQPSDVFVAGGDEINIFNQTNATINHQEEKIDIINNLVNRLLISQTDSFTYQDTVYITNVLKRLGVTDVNNFMRQVSNLIQENNNTRAQISVLNQTVNKYKTVKGDEAESAKEDLKAEGVEAVSEGPYYLHQNIFNRLDTRNLYSEVTELVRAEMAGNQLTNVMLSLTEQIRTGDHLHLQNLKNEILQKPLPLIYSHENIYEDETVLINEGDEREVVKNNLSQAVLLSIVDRVYEVYGSRINRNDNSWYYVSNALYETVSNTIERYTQNIAGPVYSAVRQIQNLAQINNDEVLMQTLETVSTLSREEELLQYIEEINERNISNEVAYRQALENFRERAAAEKKAPQAPDRERQKRESLMALSGETQLLQEYKEAGNTPVTEDIPESERIFMQELPPDVRQYMELVQQAITIQRQGGNDTNENLAGLQQDISRIEMINRGVESAPVQIDDEVAAAPRSAQQLIERVTQREMGTDITTQSITNVTQNEFTTAPLTHVTYEGDSIFTTDSDTFLQEIVTGVQQNAARAAEASSDAPVRIVHPEAVSEAAIKALRVIDSLTESGEVINSSHRVQDVHNEDIHFVHKENETLDSEEIVERLRQEKVITQEEQRVVHENHETSTTVNKTEIKREVINELTDSSKLSGLVSKSVQSELSQLSDQIYSKLERKLSNEKRRRGL